MSGLLAAPTGVAETPLGPQIAFWACALLIIGGSLVTITRRNTVTAVMALVATFFGLAALYTLLAAHFLAAIQVLVYAGAIMTLFVFVVMVLNRDEQEPWALRGLLTKGLGAIALVWLIAKAGALLLASSSDPLLMLHRELPPEGWGGVADVGMVLFTTYLFPFEAISLMLLVAVIGAVVVARSPQRGDDDAAPGATPAAAAPPSTPTAMLGGH